MAVLLLLCLFDMSYGFYQLVRFIALVLFALLAYEFHSKGDKPKSFLYLSLAVLFQPLLKISFGRSFWNIIDIIVAIWLIIQAGILLKNRVQKEIV